MKKRTVLMLLLCALTLTGCGPSQDSGGEEPSNPVGEPVNQSEMPASTAPVPDESSKSSLPSGLPTTLASEQDLTCNGGYLLIGELPEEGIALYCDNAEERNHAYLRYGEHFQAFGQDAWIDPTVLPELIWEDWDEDGTMDLAVNYLRHEGLYYDGTSWGPGLVYEHVVYLWDGAQWQDVHFSSSGPDMQNAQTQ